MAELIDKSAIVDEIEKLIADETESIKSFEHSKNASEVQRSNARIDVLMHLCSLLDTLEVKDVDFEKEFKNFLDKVEGMPRMWHSDEQIEWAKDIASHFYGLGLKARKEEVE